MAGFLNASGGSSAVSESWRQFAVWLASFQTPRHQAAHSSVHSKPTVTELVSRSRNREISDSCRDSAPKSHDFGYGTVNSPARIVLESKRVQRFDVPRNRGRLPRKQVVGGLILSRSGALT